MTAALVGHGFPFDVVESWSDEERFAQAIIIGEISGGKWNWSVMGWEERQ